MKKIDKTLFIGCVIVALLALFLLCIECTSDKQKEINALEKYISNSSMELRILAQEQETSEITYVGVSSNDTSALRIAKENYMLAAERYQFRVETTYFARVRLNSLLNHN